jgi:hypothetical protein
LKEIEMHTLSRITGKAAVAVAVLALVGSASAATPGSTDIWANQFREAFSGEAGPAAITRTPGGQIGSTDLWSNQFRVSFGAGARGVAPKNVSVAGSTDLWGNGFRDSFAGPRNPTAVEAIGLREAKGTPLR